MGGLLAVVALPLMLLGGLALDAWSYDDGPAHKDDDAPPDVSDVPVGDGPALI